MIDFFDWRIMNYQTNKNNDDDNKMGEGGTEFLFQFNCLDNFLSFFIGGRLDLFAPINLSSLAWISH